MLIQSQPADKLRHVRMVNTLHECKPVMFTNAAEIESI